MNISLPLQKDQEAWIAAKVAAGATIEQVIEDAITWSMLQEKEMEADDLAWAKPLVDEAIAEVERGEFITLEELEQHMDKTMRDLKASSSDG